MLVFVRIFFFILLVHAPSMWTRSAAERVSLYNKKIVMFVIEKTSGSREFCGSGGMNHAKHLLSSFLGIASVLDKREPVIVRPAYIFAKSHGEIPESVKWADMFDWSVDSEEFKSPDDIWNTLKAQPDRFEVLDIYKNPHKLVKRMQTSQAEIVLLHM